MRIQIKEILTTKVAIFCMALLLLFNMSQLFLMEKNKKVKNKEDYIQEINQIINHEKSEILIYKNSEVYKKSDYIRAYVKMNEISLNINEKAKKQIDMQLSKDQFERTMLIRYINIKFVTFNQYADENKGCQYFQELYEKELNTFSNLIDWKSWDKEAYNFHDINDKMSDAEEYYYDNNMRLDNALYLLEHNLHPYTMEDASSEVYITHLFGKDSMNEIVVMSMLIVFLLSWLMMLRKSNAMKLLCTQPYSLFSILMKQTFVLMISFVIMLVVSYGIPILISIMMYGMPSLNYPMLLYTNGLTSFTKYSPYTMTEPFELSYVTTSLVDTNGSHVFLAKELEIVPFYVYYLLVFILFTLKIFVVSLCTMSIAFWFKKAKHISVIGYLLIIGYALSQLVFHDISFFSPFSIDTSYSIASGSGTITYFHACIVLVISIVTIFVMNFIVSKKLTIE